MQHLGDDHDKGDADRDDGHGPAGARAGRRLQQVSLCRRRTRPARARPATTTPPPANTRDVRTGEQTRHRQRAADPERDHGEHEHRDRPLRRHRPKRRHDAKAERERGRDHGRATGQHRPGRVQLDLPTVVAEHGRQDPAGEKQRGREHPDVDAPPQPGVGGVDDAGQPLDAGEHQHQRTTARRSRPAGRARGGRTGRTAPAPPLTSHHPTVTATAAPIVRRAARLALGTARRCP